VRDNEFRGTVLKEPGRVGSFQPHQLDYDWRFSDYSAARIAGEARSTGHILLLGCPTLVAPLEKLERKGALVERNPNYTPTSGFRLIRVDLRFEQPEAPHELSYDLCVVDPPWYPQEFLSWMRTGLSMIRLGGAVLFTLWPPSVRPSTSSEHYTIFKALSAIGTVEELGSVDYQLPPFEEMTLREAGLSPPKREGLLFKLWKQTEEQLLVPPFVRTRSKWCRFTISGEQVAIKIDEPSKVSSDGWLFHTEPFVLRTTSRRDPILSSINIWTSQNVVARLIKPSHAVYGISKRDKFHIQMLIEKMQMKFDPENIGWGMSWQHQA
jgi:hypothetical protein